MKKVLLSLVAMMALAVPAMAGSGNIIVNGDFENGLSNWTQAGPGTAAWNYAQHPIEAQVLGQYTPVNVNDYTGANLGTLDYLAAKSGQSVVWVRSGQQSETPGDYMFSYIYQDIYVQPNVQYTITKFNWDAFSCSYFERDINGNIELSNQAAACMLVRIDDQINVLYNGDDNSTYKFRSTAWNSASQGDWIQKAVTAGSTFTSTTGRIQIQLRFQDIDGGKRSGYFYGQDDMASQFMYAGFDNLDLELDKPVVPEPSSLLALLTGAISFGGLAIRRRK